VLGTLGLEDTSQRRSYVSRQIKTLGIDVGHFPKPGLLYTDEDLRMAVARSVTMVEVATVLGAKPMGGTIHYLKRRIDSLGLDTSHFNQARPRASTRSRPTSAGFGPEQFFRAKSPTIRRALTTTGVPERCVGCGTGPEWQGRPLTLELDHINGDFRDNRRENLRFLCPNCHATTDNYCRKKRIR
jgi:hypothetical protein